MFFRESRRSLAARPPPTYNARMDSQPTERRGPDWNEMARSFDRWLPHIQPVGDRLIDLADIRPGHEVLDVACGTGEPSLSVARRFPGRIRVTGVDTAHAMLARAREKAASEGLAGMSYDVMSAERMAFPHERFDRVLCRFGLMLLDDPVQGAREMWRVLRPHGRIALAVWGPLPKMTSVYPLWKLLPDYLPPADCPPEPKMTALGIPGVLERVLTEAGWEAWRVEPMTVVFPFDTPLAFWNLATEAGLFKELLPKFSCHALVAFKARALADIAAYRRGDAIELANDAWLAVAEKPSGEPRPN